MVGSGGAEWQSKQQWGIESAWAGAGARTGAEAGRHEGRDGARGMGRDRGKDWGRMTGAGALHVVGKCTHREPITWLQCHKYQIQLLKVQSNLHSAP